MREIPLVVVPCIRAPNRSGPRPTCGSLEEAPVHSKLLPPVVPIALAIFAAAAHAFPIASPGTEGRLVVVAGNAAVVATYQGNSASYSDDLYLMLDASGNPGDDGNLTNDLLVFNNHSSPVGSTKSLGTFAPGTELEFRLFVHNTGDNFVTGPAARNVDGMAHARVQNDWQPNTTLVSFEDLYGTPEGAGGFNDLSFSFTNTTNNQAPIAEGFPANGLIDVCNVANQSFQLVTDFKSPEADQSTSTTVVTNLPAGRWTLTNSPGNTSNQTLNFFPGREDLGKTYSATYTATDNGAPPLSTTVHVDFVVTMQNCPTPARRSSWGAIKSVYR